jgi:hypothetical protein
MEPAREQQPTGPEPAAAARAVVVESAPVSPAQAQLLMLQRHAGNAAVGRLLRTRRMIQRDDLDPGLAPDPGLMPDHGIITLEGGKGASGDRYDSLDPGNPSSTPATVLQKINPAAPAFTKYPCTQNCPAAASAAQDYLMTGTLPSSACSPLNEPAGYAISPGPENWPATGKTWADAWKGIQAATATHGTQVMVEADRGASKPDNLTQWHYFVVMNARNKRVAIDAFLGEVDADVGRYVNRLAAKTYSFTSERVTAKPVRR